MRLTAPGESDPEATNFASLGFQPLLRASMIVTSNKPFNAWGDVVGGSGTHVHGHRCDRPDTCIERLKDRKRGFADALRLRVGR